MNELFSSVITKVEKYLSSKNFVLKGKSTFVCREPELKKENSIILYHREYQQPCNYVKITVACNIYYKQVNMLDEKIIRDFINSSPVISGSTGYFREDNKQCFSIHIGDVSEVNAVSKEIIKNIEEGAFNLFASFPTLESILNAIENEHAVFGVFDYVNPDLRLSVRRACIVCLVHGKDEAIKWFVNHAPSKKNKSEFLKKMICEW